jgi:hypothetical protein
MYTVVINNFFSKVVKGFGLDKSVLTSAASKCE